MKLSAKTMRIFRRAQRKYKVSTEFLKSNMANIRQFVLYAVSPHIVIKIQALRKRCRGGSGQRVVLDYYHLRRFLFDPARRKMIKRRKRNVQQWSKRMVFHLKSRIGYQEYVEDEEDVEKPELTEIPAPVMAPEEVSKQLKKQLELLRSDKRIAKFIAGSVNVSDASKNNANDNTQLEELTDTQPEISLGKFPVIADTEKLMESGVQEKEDPIVEVAQVDATHLLTSIVDEVQTEQEICEKTPEKQIVAAPTNCFIENLLQQQKTTKNKDIDEKTEEGDRDRSCDLPTDTDVNGANNTVLETSKRSSSSFLDMLMSKVRVQKMSIEEGNNKSHSDSDTSQLKDQQQSCRQTEAAELTDSSEEFLGFEETERPPGMLHTPLVPFSKKTTASSAFVSELLNDYMRDNLLESSESKDEAHDGFRRIHRQANFDGLVTPTAIPPSMSMPAVPESLQRLRTVAERRQFLHKFSKNHKLAIINNEATIYRELQRKIRQQKVKSAPLQMLQAPGANMPFTRQGWQAASFVVTDYNKYFYQMLQIDGSAELIKLPGVRGNNEEKLKKPHVSRLPKSLKAIIRNCPDSCYDLLAWRDFKAIKTQANKAKLNKNPFRPVFPPCPLSQKPFQKPLDDETAALLLAGGSMAVVRMPTVELEVFPKISQPLHEVAKRYLQYILPHHDISREWAEFSVSTLQHQLPRTVKEAEQAAAAANAAEGNGRRKSFTFAIPYLNDRNHILVRRVVDRSEQLDRSFEESRDTSNTVADLSFRVGIDPTDTLLQECADVVSDMITSVAISCSENSFIKDDPHGVNSESSQILEKAAKTQKDKDLGVLANKATDSRGGIVSMPQQNKRQHRLLLELRRLNATIIDAGAKQEKESKPCFKEYCALGCICSSLTDEYPMRKHCGKSKCVIECHCKIPNNSHIMRLETDGRSITTEDAFLLRRKATARLARMEKEFTSTIVLTGNETLLINESQYDKKRRCTKVPKRYDDFTDADDDFQGSASSSAQQTNSGAMVSFETTCSASVEELKSPHGNSTYSELTTELREPIYIMDTILNELKHCSVTLVPLQDIKNVAVWCMVHELYKCYCGGRAIDGKPLVIEKEDVNVTIDAVKIGDEDFVAATAKARYSFEKLEQEVTSTAAIRPNSIVNLNEDSSESVRLIMENDNEIDSADTGDEEQTSSNEEEDDNDDDSYGANYKPHLNIKSSMQKRGRPQKIERRGRPLEATIIRDYMNAKLNWCRRVVAVPMKIYTRRNRRRLDEVQEYIRNNENAKTQLILNEHILRSVYYHKHELEKTIKAADKEKQLQIKSEKTPLQVPRSSELPKPAPAQAPTPTCHTPDVRVIDNDVQIIDDNLTQSSLISVASTKSQRRRERRKRLRTEMLAANSNAVKEVMPIDISKKPRLAMDVPSTEIKLTASTTAPYQAPESAQISTTCIQMPKISNYYSLNQQSSKSSAADATPVASTDTAPAEVQCNQLPTTADICAATQGAESQTAADLGLIEGAVSTDNFKEFYNVVIKNMNNLVSKKMQDIDMALKRESKVIPPPNEEILCIIKWSNFLDAFIEGYVYIWEVQLDDPQQRPFLAATITNLMPMIFGAVGVVNIAALQGKQLPLVGRMLLERCRSEKTRKLAIVMQGRSKYWLVKGFLHPDSTKACAKPTPHTHPLLTRKINVLCSLLVKQRVKEHQRKLELQQQQQQQQEKIATATAQNQQVPEVEYLQNRPVVARRILPKPLHSTQVSVSEPDSSRSVIAAQKPTLPTNKTIPPASRVQAQQRQQTSSSNLLRTLAAREEFLNMKSNIEFRKVTLLDIEEIQLPQMHQDDHRWLVLDLCNDFSHIFVPDFRDLVSLDRIQKVMAFSRQRKKNVKLQFFQNAPYDAFVTPSSKRNIYFGPLKFNMRPPLLILLQSVDGQMMQREVFQQQHQIQTAGRQRTTAFWILQINGQVHYQIDGDPNTDHLQHQLNMQQEIDLKNAQQAELQRQLEPENHVEDSDEDCVIVEDNDSKEKSNDEPEDIGELVDTQQLEQPDKYCSIVTNPKSNGIPLLSQALPQAISMDSPTNTSQASSSPMRMNFTIQAVDSSSHLQITPDPANGLSHMQVQESMMGTGGTLIPLPVTMANNTITQQLPGFMPLSVVITNVSPAPQEAPYSSTIYVSNMPGAPDNDVAAAANSIMAAVSADGAATQITATTSNSSSNMPAFQTFQISNTTPQTTNNTTPSASTALVPRPAITTAAPIKRRRMSLRCPLMADTETRNIAIDAAIKLLPDPDNKMVSQEVCVEELDILHPTKQPKLTKQSSFVEVEPVKTSTPTTTATTATTTTTTMLLHNTTITKLNANDNATPAFNTKTKTSAASWQKSAENNTRKFKYLLPKSAAEVAINAAEQSSAITAIPPQPTSTPTQPQPQPKPKPQSQPQPQTPPPPAKSTATAPIVFDVNFIDNADEPSASIVIKPTLIAQNKFPPTSAANTLTNKPTIAATMAASLGNAVVNSSSPSKSQNNTMLKSQLTTSTTAIPKVKTTISAGNARVKPKPPTTTVRMVTKPGVMGNQNATVTSLPTYNIQKHVTITQSAASSSQGSSSSTIITMPKNKKVPNNKTDPLFNVAASASNYVQANSRLSMPTMSSSATVTTTWNQSPKKIAALTTSFAQQRSSLPVTSPKYTQNITLNSTSAIVNTLNATSAKQSVVGNSQQDAQYGYFSTNVAGFPKFVVKRIDNDYLIKVPNCQGILKISGMENVNQYLNRHMLKCSNPSEICGKLPANWMFVPQDRLNPIYRKNKEVPNEEGKMNSNSSSGQYVDGNSRKSNKLPQVISLNRRVTLSAPIPVKAVVKVQTPKVAPSLATSATNDKCDTILIED